jgi:hypothetical protein
MVVWLQKYITEKVIKSGHGIFPITYADARLVVKRRARRRAPNSDHMISYGFAFKMITRRQGGDDAGVHGGTSRSRRRGRPHKRSGAGLYALHRGGTYSADPTRSEGPHSEGLNAISYQKTCRHICLQIRRSDFVSLQAGVTGTD